MACPHCGKDGCEPLTYVAEVVLTVKPWNGGDPIVERKIAVPTPPVVRCTGGACGATVNVWFYTSTADEMARKREEYEKLRTMFEGHP